MAKLNADRRWFLSRYVAQQGYWADMLAAKKWGEHRDRCVKLGLLEQLGDGGAALWRITDAGRQALAEKG